MRLRFREVILPTTVKIGGHEMLMAGTFLGLAGGEWIEANGVSIEARLLLKEPGYPGERCGVCIGAICATEEAPPVGTIITLGGQRVGFVAESETIVFMIEPLLNRNEVGDDYTPGDTTVGRGVQVEESKATGGVRHRNRRNIEYADAL